MILSTATIKNIAGRNGYIQRREEASNTLFFKSENPVPPDGGYPGTLINVFYTTGGIMTKLSHPTRGYNQLWRSDAYDSVDTLDAIFANPRLHTGQGYRQASGAKRGCIGCGILKKKVEFIVKINGVRVQVVRSVQIVFSKRRAIVIMSRERKQLVLCWVVLVQNILLLIQSFTPVMYVGIQSMMLSPVMLMVVIRLHQQSGVTVVHLCTTVQRNANAVI